MPFHVVSVSIWDSTTYTDWRRRLHQTQLVNKLILCTFLSLRDSFWNFSFLFIFLLPSVLSMLISLIFRVSTVCSTWNQAKMILIIIIIIKVNYPLIIPHGAIPLWKAHEKKVSTLGFTRLHPSYKVYTQNLKNIYKHNIFLTHNTHTHTPMHAHTYAHSLPAWPGCWKQPHTQSSHPMDCTC